MLVFRKILRTYLMDDPLERIVMIQRSFEVGSITTTNLGLVHYDDFSIRIMANIEVDSDRSYDDDMFRDLFQN